MAIITSKVEVHTINSTAALMFSVGDVLGDYVVYWNVNKVSWLILFRYPLPRSQPVKEHSELATYFIKV